MNVYSNPHFDNHEQVVFCNDARSGLRAIIAVHSTRLGPSLGGCRIWPYTNEEEALVDVLRLSRGMTYKAALAGLSRGGGKSVIIADPHQQKSEAMMRAMGRFVENLGGRYIVAEDSGSSVTDITRMGLETRHVGGVGQRYDENGNMRTGDPSPATAYGVFVALRAAVKQRFGRSDLSGLKVAVQGTGNVGRRVAQHLSEAGARLWVSDIFETQMQQVVETTGASAVDPEQIAFQDVDVFAPCAMGAVLNDRTIAGLRAKVVAGAANNQLAEDRHGLQLMERGVLYAPDYAANAGGIIDIYYEKDNAPWTTVREHLERIHDTLTEIFSRAESARLPTNQVADQLAEERFLGVPPH